MPILPIPASLADKSGDKKVVMEPVRGPAEAAAGGAARRSTRVLGRLGCGGPEPDLDVAAPASGDQQERELDIDVEVRDHVEDAKNELRRGVAGTDVDDPGPGLPLPNGDRAEVAVVREDHPTVLERRSYDLEIGAACQTTLDDRQDVVPTGSQAVDDARVEVLVRQQRMVERPSHAGSFTSQTDSFLIERAA